MNDSEQEDKIDASDSSQQVLAMLHQELAHQQQQSDSNDTNPDIDLNDNENDNDNDNENSQDGNNSKGKGKKRGQYEKYTDQQKEAFFYLVNEKNINVPLAARELKIKTRTAQRWLQVEDFRKPKEDGTTNINAGTSSISSSGHIHSALTESDYKNGSNPGHGNRSLAAALAAALNGSPATAAAATTAIAGTSVSNTNDAVSSSHPQQQIIPALITAKRGGKPAFVLPESLQSVDRTVYNALDEKFITMKTERNRLAKEVDRLNSKNVELQSKLDSWTRLWAGTNDEATRLLKSGQKRKRSTKKEKEEKEKRVPTTTAESSSSSAAATNDLIMAESSAMASDN